MSSSDICQIAEIAKLGEYCKTLKFCMPFI